MPLAAFTPENEVRSSQLFPRLKMAHNEMGRICVLDKAPEYRWVHDLRMPRIENGEAVKVTRERKDKTTYETYDFELVSSDQCLGDDAIMAKDGFDPDHCPACARAKAGGDAIQPATRLLAMHIFKYGTIPNTQDVAAPFQGQVLVWRFRDAMFSKLVGFAQEHGSLQRLDLKLKCNSSQYQTYDVTPGGQGKAEWLVPDNPPAMKTITNDAGEQQTVIDVAAQSRYQFVASSLAAARADGHTLEQFLGRKQDRAGMQAHINQVDERWRVVNHVGVGVQQATAAVGTGNLNSEFDDLLSQSADQAVAPATSTPPAQPAPAGDGVPGDPWSAVAPPAQPAPAAAPPAQAAPAEPVAAPAPAEPVAVAAAAAPAMAPAQAAPAPQPTGETVDFDDLLSGL